MNFWQSTVDIIEKIFTEDKTQSQKYQSALNKGRMRKTNQIKNLPNQPGIYRFVNKLTGTINYVGQTNNIKRRISEHKSSGNFNSAIHTIVYGIAKANATRDSLCFTEKQHIKKHNPRNNKTKGGNGRR